MTSPIFLVDIAYTFLDVDESHLILADRQVALPLGLVLLLHFSDLQVSKTNHTPVHGRIFSLRAACDGVINIAFAGSNLIRCLKTYIN